MTADEKKKLLQQLVDQVRTTEAALLERSRQNLLVMKPAMEMGKGIHLVPSVLSTFSVALVVTGTFLNASMGSSRLLIHHSETVLSFVNDLAKLDDDTLLRVSSWRSPQAGNLVPWLEQKLAEIQAILEMFEEQQRAVVSPHLVTMNKIMEISGMLADAGQSLVIAIWAYIANRFTVAFAQNLIDELIDAIDQAPESFARLVFYRHAAERKIAEIIADISAFRADGKRPEGVAIGDLTRERRTSAISQTHVSLAEYAKEIATLHASVGDFDKSMATMARTLPCFVRSLVKFVTIWNKESPHLAQPD